MIPDKKVPIIPATCPLQLGSRVQWRDGQRRLRSGVLVFWNPLLAQVVETSDQAARRRHNLLRQCGRFSAGGDRYDPEDHTSISLTDCRLVSAPA